jgi:hypothetical protein
VSLGALAGLVLLSCGLCVYRVQLAHREVALLAEAAGIRIGASEAAVLPMVERYGGEKWMPEPPVALEECPVQEECEYQNARRPDYAYNLELAPLHALPESHPPKDLLGRAISYLMYEVPRAWREPFFLRNSIVDVSIGIRGGQVISVHAGLFVEGRTRWLGDTWNVAREMPRGYLSTGPYRVGGSALTFPGGGGGGMDHLLVPSAAEDQFQAAQSFHAGCISGLNPCRCLRELVPEAFAYLGEHPEVGTVVDGDGCPKWVR